MKLQINLNPKYLAAKGVVGLVALALIGAVIKTERAVDDKLEARYPGPGVKLR